MVAPVELEDMEGTEEVTRDGFLNLIHRLKAIIFKTSYFLLRGIVLRVRLMFYMVQHKPK